MQNQVALVTGAGRRIGREVALTLGRAGASIVVNYNQSKAEARATVGEIARFGVEAIALRADVSRPAQVRAMFRAVEKRFGRLDILVNNAAVFFPGAWDELRDEDWDRILAINLKGTFFCAQAAARLMQRQKRGRIINISSLGGIQAWPRHLHYCASKAAVIMLTRCLAKAFAPAIQVNSVAPGTILFPDDKPERARNEIRTTLLRRPGRAQDIAQTVLFLAAQGEFITGQVLVVDGGKSVR